MANSDKRQAALDAVQDILKARLASAMGQAGMPGGMGQGGEHDVDVDPELNTPEATGPQGSSNIEINDPDDVLGQKKNRQQQQLQSGGSQKQQQKQSDSSGSGNSNGSSGGDSGDDESEDSGDSGSSQGGSSKGGKNKGSKQSSGSSSGGDAEDDEADEGKDGENEKPEQLRKSDEYVKDWNDAIDKFDNDETSDSELDKQIKDKDNSKGTKEACAAIKSSRIRKLEIDPSTDERLKMPKNSEVKQFDDSDDEGEETEAERQTRVDKIQKEFDDAEQVQKDLQDIETDIAIKKGDAMRAQKKEIDRVARKGQLMDFQNFGVDLFKSVKSQLAQSRTPDDSYERVNPIYAGSDLLMPGQQYNDKYEKPVINVYFDQSGSWGEGEIKKGIDALSSIRRFEAQHKIKINLFYFADHLHDKAQDARWEGGTSGFDEVVKHVRDSGANNVIILTDSDIEHQTRWNRTPKVQVKGCVWYLWKNGSRSITAPEYLSGLRDTYQYNLQ